LAKAEKPKSIKVAEAGHGAAAAKEEKDTEHAAIPSIRPNLKAVAEAAKEPKAPAPPPATREIAPAKPSTVVVHSTSHAPVRKARKTPKSEGYMLELAQTEPAVQHANIHWDYEGPGGLTTGPISARTTSPAPSASANHRSTSRTASRSIWSRSSSTIVRRRSASSITAIPFRSRLVRIRYR
jgi:hypothetical protein